MFETTRAILAISWKNALAWRFSMVLSLLTGPMIIFVNYTIWTAIYKTTGKMLLGGYTLEQMITYTVISFTLGYLIWDDIDETLHEDILTGRLTSTLLKPMSYMYFHFLQKIGHRFLAMLIEYVPVIIITGFLLGFDVYTSHRIGYYLAAIPIAFVIRYFIQALLGIMAFWLVKPKGIKWVYRMASGFLAGIGFSLTLYPPVFQKIFFLLPFQFLAYVPTQLFMGTYKLGNVTLSPPAVLAYGVLHAIVLYILVMLAWKISIKKYCGAGT